VTGGAHSVGCGEKAIAGVHRAVAPTPAGRQARGCSCRLGRRRWSPWLRTVETGRRPGRNRPFGAAAAIHLHGSLLTMTCHLSERTGSLPSNVGLALVAGLLPDRKPAFRVGSTDR
jgi:hypothetical protein